MADFRKHLSAKTRNEHSLLFWAQDLASMAASLVASSRALADSGLFSPEQPVSHWSPDEWAIYRCIPALAKRLDPALELRADEIAKPGEGPNPLTLIEMGDNEEMLTAIRSILASGGVKRPSDRPKGERASPGILLDFRKLGCAVSVADESEPLTGVQLIGSYGDHDRVLRYEESEADLEDLFRVASAMRLAEELSDQDKVIARRLRSWPERLDFDALSIQTADGTVLREISFAAEEDPEPSM